MSLWRRESPGRARWAAALLVAALALWTGCATAPSPGQLGYPFNLRGSYQGRLALRDTTWEARIRMETMEGGHVSGSLATSAPRVLEGDFSGTLEHDSLVWRSSWVAPASGCSGILVGRGPVAREGVSLKGELRMRGSCAGSSPGSYELRR